MHKLSEVQEFDKVAKAALVDELLKIAEVNPNPWVQAQIRKFASSPELIERLTKEAVFSALRAGAGRVGGFLRGAPVKTQFGEIPMKPMLPSFKGMGGRMETAGQQMRETAEQAVTRKGHVLSPQQASNLRSDVTAAGIPQPGAATRIGGHMVESTGKHISHATPTGAILKSVGIPLGGAMEGLARGTGEELVRGSGAVRTGLSGVGRSTMGGGIRGSLGRGLQTAAPRIGTAGELVGVPALAAAVGGPISGLGLIGGKALGAAAPALEHVLHAGGEFLHHVGSDVAGVAGQKAGVLGGRLGSVAASLKGKLLGRAAGAVA